MNTPNALTSAATGMRTQAAELDTVALNLATLNRGISLAHRSIFAIR